MAEVDKPRPSVSRARRRLQTATDTTWLAAATMYVAYVLGSHLGFQPERFDIVVLLAIAFATSVAAPMTFARGNYSVVIDLSDTVVLTGMFFVSRYDLLLVIVLGYAIGQMRPTRGFGREFIGLCDLIVTFAPIGLFLHLPIKTLDNHALFVLAYMGLLVAVPNVVFHVLYSVISGSHRLPNATGRVVGIRVFNSVLNISVAAIALVLLKDQPVAMAALFVLVGAFVIVMRSARRTVRDHDRLRWLVELSRSLSADPDNDVLDHVSISLQEFIPNVKFSICDYQPTTDSLHEVFTLGSFPGGERWLLVRLSPGSANALSDDDRGFLEAVCETIETHHKKLTMSHMLSDARLHDALTGLPTRRLLDELINGTISNAYRNNSHCGILSINCDSFRKINAEFGHDEGDIFLIELAARIRYALRGNDIVARVGGDEFVVVLPSVRNKTDIERVIVKILDALESPINAGDGIKAWVSMGAALFPENGHTAKELIEMSEAALREAKQSQAGWVFASRATLSRHDAPSPPVEWQHTVGS